MIPINDLQAKIYQALKDVGVKVYDEVQEGATMPLISIGDYILSSLEFKDNGFSFNWTICLRGYFRWLRRAYRG